MGKARGHETPELRQEVANTIPRIGELLDLPTLELDAASARALIEAEQRVLAVTRQVG